MSEFNFKSRKNLVTLTIEGTPYAFDVSPTNYQFVKNVATMAQEIEALSKNLSTMKQEDWGQIEAAYDMILEKQKTVIDTILPGRWADLFSAAGEDLLNMVDLIVFIGQEIRSAAAKAQMQAVTPAAPVGQEV